MAKLPRRRNHEGADRTTHSGPHRAFTLIELLVVIAILCLLLSLLLPTITRAKFLARVTVCAAHLHEFAAVNAAYAGAHDGYLPRLDMRKTGLNLWDVSPEFVRMLKEDYGLPHEMFFCPLVWGRGGCAESGPDSWWFFGPHWPRDPNYRKLGYNVWIPRRNGAHYFIPQEVAATGPYAGETVRGPVGLLDPQASKTPILTDFVGTWHPLSQDFGQPGDPDFPRINLSETADQTRWLNNHVYRNGLLENVNEAWADGHVERVPAENVYPRYRHTGSANQSWMWW